MRLIIKGLYCWETFVKTASVFLIVFYLWSLLYLISLLPPTNFFIDCCRGAPIQLRRFVNDTVNKPAHSLASLLWNLRVTCVQKMKSLYHGAFNCGRKTPYKSFWMCLAFVSVVPTAFVCSVRHYCSLLSYTRRSRVKNEVLMLTALTKLLCKLFFPDWNHSYNDLHILCVGTTAKVILQRYRFRIWICYFWQRRPGGKSLRNTFSRNQQQDGRFHGKHGLTSCFATGAFQLLLTVSLLHYLPLFSEMQLDVILH